MRRLKINKELASILLAGTVLLVGCSAKNNVKEVDLSNIVRDNINVYAEELETESEIVEEIKTTKLITKDDLNIRKGPNTHSDIIDTVNVGSELVGVKLSGEWYEIIYNGKTAYVKAEYVYEKVEKNGSKKESETSESNGLEIETKSYVEAKETVNIRSDATVESNILSVLEEGNSLEAVRLLDNGWYEVKFNGDNAYIKADYVKEISKNKIVSPMEKIVMFNHDSEVYSDINMENEAFDVDKYEIAYIYGEMDNMYVATINDNIVYVVKDDVTTLEDKVVIVDISEQNAKLYDHNNIIVDTPVVTGGPDTPSDLGYFSIYSIDPDRTLRGPGYSVFTDISMFYNGGEALHDAEYHTDYDSDGNEIISHGWRSYDEFGGDTYKYDGSHGCVNLPNEAAMNIYHNVELGTKVLVKK